MLYQLSYARVPSGGGRIRTFVARKRGRFTVCSLWPLGHPTLGDSPRRRSHSSPTDNTPRVVSHAAGCVSVVTCSTFGRASYLSRPQHLSQPRDTPGGVTLAQRRKLTPGLEPGTC